MKKRLKNKLGKKTNENPACKKAFVHGGEFTVGVSLAVAQYVEKEPTEIDAKEFVELAKKMFLKAAWHRGYLLDMASLNYGQHKKWTLLAFGNVAGILGVYVGKARARRLNNMINLPTPSHFGDYGIQSK